MIKRQITVDDALGDISACSANDIFFLHDFLERVVDIFDSPTPPEFTLANFCVKKSGRHKSSTGLALQSIIRHIFYLKSKELAEMRDFIWEEIAQRMNGPDALANTSDKLYALSLLAHFQARHPDTSDIDVNKVRAMILANEVHSGERTLPVAASGRDSVSSQDFLSLCATTSGPNAEKYVGLQLDPAAT
jgi:hypothetical protein